MIEVFLSDLNFIIPLFFIGIISGALNAMGGSGGLVILIYMIASGIHPALALGTARLANIFPMMIAARKFNQSGHIHYKYLLPLAVIAVIAGSLGTVIVIQAPEDIIYKIVGSLLLFIAPLIAFKKDFGLYNTIKSKNAKIWGYILYFVAMIYAGFFGAGASVFVIYILVVFFGMKSIEALSIHTVLWIIMSVISSLIFIFAGEVDYRYLFIILVSMSIGSAIGANIAVKKGSQLINSFVSIFAFIMGLKLLFFS